METGNTGKSPNFQRELAVRTLVLYAVKLISLEQVDSLMKQYRNSFDGSFRASVRGHFCLCLPLCIVCEDFAHRISQSGEVSFNPVANRECEIQSALQSGWKLVSAEYRGVFVVSSTSHIRERSGPPRVFVRDSRSFTKTWLFSHARRFIYGALRRNEAYDCRRICEEYL